MRLMKRVYFAVSTNVLKVSWYFSHTDKKREFVFLGKLHCRITKCRSRRGDESPNLKLRWVKEKSSLSHDLK